MNKNGGMVARYLGTHGIWMDTVFGWTRYPVLGGFTVYINIYINHYYIKSNLREMQLQ